MSAPVLPVAAPFVPAAIEPTRIVDGKFAQRLAQLANVSTAGGNIVRQLEAELVQGERSLNAVIAMMKAHQTVTPIELLALQAGMYRYTMMVELLGKVISELTRALRTLLEMKV